MDLRMTEALRGYAQGRPATAAEPPGESSFQPALSRVGRSFSETLNQGDAAATAAMTGKATGHDLVTALAQSQLVVETAVAVRNKVVEAYQELLRMPV